MHGFRVSSVWNRAPCNVYWYFNRFTWTQYKMRGLYTACDYMSASILHAYDYIAKTGGHQKDTSFFVRMVLEYNVTSDIYIRVRVKPEGNGNIPFIVIKIGCAIQASIWNFY
jgi:hypothetical protein